MKKLKGFTLAETLVTLGIIGIVAAVVMPLIGRIRPNEEMIMLRKAYYLTSRTVNELINDEDFYPDTDDPNTSGFSNTNPDPPARYHGETFEGMDKFCRLFAARMNVQGDINCVAMDFFLNGRPSDGQFTTTDGIAWILPIGNFNSGAANGGASHIFVDVNGRRGPNCFPGPECTKNPDRYDILVDRWGKIFVDDATRLMLTATDMTSTYEQLSNQ